jgi:predicted PurR-regulated permease PerM
MPATATSQGIHDMSGSTSHGRIYLFWALGFTLLLIATAFMRHTLSAILTSLAAAYLLNPILKFLEARGFPRWLSLIFLYGIVLFGCFISSFFLVPYIAFQIDLLARSLPGYMQNLRIVFDGWQRELSVYYTADEMEWIAEQAMSFLNQLVAGISGKEYGRVKGLAFALFDLILAPILVYFLLYYKERAKEFMLGLLPAGSRADLKSIGNRINRTLERFLYAMLFDCLLVGFLCSAALYWMGIDFPLLNGLAAGFATVVPFIGASIAVIPPALIGYLKTGDLMIIPKICAIYFIINVVVEGNIIKPLLMRGTLQLNPLAVIFALMAMGEVMGFWGVVLAVPFTAVVRICSDDIHSLLLGESHA